jgi:hypothetical protein
VHNGVLTVHQGERALGRVWPANHIPQRGLRLACSCAAALLRSLPAAYHFVNQWRRRLWSCWRNDTMLTPFRLWANKRSWRSPNWIPCGLRLYGGETGEPPRLWFTWASSPVSPVSNAFPLASALAAPSFCLISCARRLWFGLRWRPATTLCPFSTGAGVASHRAGELTIRVVKCVCVPPLCIPQSIPQFPLPSNFCSLTRDMKAMRWLITWIAAQEDADIVRRLREALLEPLSHATAEALPALRACCAFFGASGAVPQAHEVDALLVGAEAGLSSTSHPRCVKLGRPCVHSRPRSLLALRPSAPAS